MIDDVDKAIIEQLQQDGRLPYTKLATAVGLSEAAVRQRVQRLVESGVVQIVAVTDPLTLGFRREAMIGLKIEGDLRGVADTIASIPEVSYVVVVSVLFDLLMEVVCEDDDHLLALAQRQGALDSRGAQHRDLHLSPSVQADLRMGYPIVTKNPKHTYDVERLDDLAQRHLWMHFSRLGGFSDTTAVPIMAEGKGCYLWDARGKKYLDALSGLFTVQLGHGRSDLAEAARLRPRRSSTSRSGATRHPPAIELAAKLAELAPGDLNRVFFTTGGSEAVESAWKLARQYFRALGQPERHKVIARDTAYHGTTMGALAITGVTALKEPFEPLTPGTSHVMNTNRFRHELEDDEAAFLKVATDAIEQRILAEGPETVAAVYLEPVQNAGGCFVPPAGYFQRVREICDQYGVLLVSDEVICAFGRLGTMFGAQRFDYLPDMITCAKGLTSGYSPLGAVICRDFLAEPFLSGSASFAHGITFGGHPVSCAVGLRNLTLFEEENVLEHVQANEAEFRIRIDSLRDVPIVGDVRGAGYFLALELVADPDTRARFTKPQAEELLRGFLSPRLFEAGLIARSDDRGDPVVQLSPPLIAGPEEFDIIETTLRTCLTEAWKRMPAA